MLWRFTPEELTALDRRSQRNPHTILRYERLQVLVTCGEAVRTARTPPSSAVRGQAARMDLSSLWASGLKTVWVEQGQSILLDKVGSVGRHGREERMKRRAILYGAMRHGSRKGWPYVGKADSDWERTCDRSDDDRALGGAREGELESDIEAKDDYKPRVGRDLSPSYSTTYPPAIRSSDPIPRPFGFPMAHPLFSEAGTALPISTDPLSPPSQSQNTSPWAFPSPPSDPSPSSYQHSPSASACSPSSMIGATPTFYDPDLEAQPPAQDYHDWATSFEQQHQLALAHSSSYPPPQSSTTGPRYERQTQPPARHLNQYQFVQQHPPPAAPDPTQFTYFNSLQNQFHDRPSHSQRQQSAPEAVRQHSWSQEPTSAFTRASTSDATFLDSLIYTSDTQSSHQHQHQQAEHLSAGLAFTPVSDRMLQTPSHISPTWDQHPLPSPGGSSNAPTVIVRPSLRRGDKSSSSQAKRKRQKPESEDDDDDDGPSADPNVQQSHPNRLPGACTYCKRLKMKCLFPPGENVCKRCRSGKHECIVEGRKPRSAPKCRFLPVPVLPRFLFPLLMTMNSHFHPLVNASTFLRR
ncbi:hypothetical protein BC827DRAFT_133038 [Russula dissimulans]|nr:hypothetical protein BC827DRAFT_133038 [Russula dissimulans]